MCARLIACDRRRAVAGTTTSPVFWSRWSAAGWCTPSDRTPTGRRRLMCPSPEPSLPGSERARDSRRRTLDSRRAAPESAVDAQQTSDRANRRVRGAATDSEMDRSRPQGSRARPKCLQRAPQFQTARSAGHVSAAYYQCLMNAWRVYRVSAEWSTAGGSADWYLQCRRGAAAGSQRLNSVTRSSGTHQRRWLGRARADEAADPAVFLIDPAPRR